MAQLVKLFDYISRYESNPFHYPSQYIRLKNENWKKLQLQWENEQTRGIDYFQHEKKQNEQQKKARWNPFKKESNEQVYEKETEQPMPELLPSTKKQLTQYFLNQLYPLQIKWATSTISHESFTNITFRDTEILKYFLQRFPDIYLLLYYPIFNIKNAPIDGEIILISPVDIEIISLINKEADAVITAANDRSWVIELHGKEKRMISPVIALKRSEQIIRSILQHKEIELPIKKSIISQSNHILYSAEPYQTQIIGKRDYENWFTAKRNFKSSLKSVQIKAMDAILQHCQTSAVRRPEWEKQDQKSNRDNGD